MNILVLNSGSSTLKFDLMDVGPGAEGHKSAAIRLAHGIVDRIGQGLEPGKGATLQFTLSEGDLKQQEHRDAIVRDHGDAVLEVFKWLDTALAGDSAEDAQEAVSPSGET